MNGNLKAMGVSHARFLLKEKRTYKDVNIHFRDIDSHTLKLSNGKEAILRFSAMTIEADSLYLEADGWLKGQQDPVTKDFSAPSTMLKLRFYPHYEKSAN